MLLGGLVEQRLRTVRGDPREQHERGRRLDDGRAAGVALLQVRFEQTPVGRAQRTEDVRGIPIREVRVIRVHRVTPFSCRASRSARSA